jgi:hypothetical protein
MLATRINDGIQPRNAAKNWELYARLIQNPCFRVCVKSHEDYHESQLNNWCPEICLCSPEKTFDVGYESKEIEAIWECPAKQAAYVCMKNMINDPMTINKLQCNRQDIIDFMKIAEDDFSNECKGLKIDAAPQSPPAYP